MRRCHLWLIVAIVFTAHAIPCKAHVEDQYNSVHFHDGQPDFGTVPRRGILYLRGEEDDRPIDEGYGLGSYREDRDHVELTEDQDDWQIVLRQRHLKAMQEPVEVFIRLGKWAAACRQYQMIASVTGRTGAIQDRMEVLRQATDQRVSPASPLAAQIRRYLHAMALDDRKQSARAKSVFQQIAASPAAPFLKPHALYQLASLDYEDRHYQAALMEYGLALLCPQMHKREAIFVMIARCALLPRRKDQRNLDIGGKALTEVSVEFPETRFRHSVMGLKARLDYLQGRLGDAAHEYLALDDLSSARMISALIPEPGRSRVRAALFARYLTHLLTVTTFRDYEQTARQIDLLRKSFTPEEARDFSQLVLVQPEYASPYFYYRLYLCDDNAKDLARLARFADTIIARYPRRAKFSPEICTRLAEVYYQNDDDQKALDWVDRSLARRITDRGLFVQGATLLAMRRALAASTAFATLLNTFPNSRLRRSAREELAIADESKGELGGSLDQYFALGYTYDIAFFLDARMTVPQVQAYVETHSHASHESESHESRRDMLRYALGMRCLRAERWQDATHWLSLVSKPRYKAYAQAGSDYWDAKISPTPLVAARQLSRLQQKTRAARTRSGRAEAMLQYARYYYTNGTLLLYNNVLWQGCRAMSFGFWWNARHATDADDNAARRHMYQHEVYARAMAICLEVARRYPETPAAPRALYRAACCARHLANFNDWWREEDKKRGFWLQSVRLMKTVAQRYPRSHLARLARKYAWVFQEEKSSLW